MKLETSHEFLAMGPDFNTAQKAVLRFLDTTQLVRYDAVRVETHACLSATDAGFWPRIEQGLEDNRQVLRQLASELKESGVFSLDEALTLHQGFQSKLFHTIAHMLDGFFGIDSCFYNLATDSHWLTADLKKEIEAAPEDFWLIRVSGFLKTATREKAILLRTFEKNP